MSRAMRKSTMLFPNRSNTNRTLQSQKTDRGSKMLDLESRGFYYPCSENKGADQLPSFWEADLQLCFRICNVPFLMTPIIYGSEK